MARARTVSPSWAVLLRVGGFLTLALSTQWIAPAVGRAALAKASGGSGTSGVLSSNPTIRRQQLICDPLNPSGGSYSIQYDPSVVSYDFGSLTAVTGYTITSAFIARDFGTPGSPKPQLVDINSSAGFNNAETGYIQVFFQQSGAGYQAPTVPGGYTTLDSKGVSGNETHFLTFSYLTAVPNTTFANYTIFADPGGRPFNSGGVSTADFLKDDVGNTVPFNQIAPATVRANLIVPEPTSLGVLALAGAALLRRRR